MVGLGEGSGSNFRNGFHVISDAFRREGALAVYKGFFPQWVRCILVIGVHRTSCTPPYLTAPDIPMQARCAPYTVIQFVVWEQLCKFAGVRAV